MFLSFYGLREQPFGVTPNPRFLYESVVHREALASLMYGVESDIGFTALIAGPGMGKTTLLYHLLERYRSTASTAFIFDTQCTSSELLVNLLAEFELDFNGSEAVLRNRLREFLVSQAQARRRAIVFLDEAQNLQEPVLETVRLLSNFETSSAKLLHIIMAGQEQLEQKLARPELAQLRQRIAMFTRLTPFSPQETSEYIAHRLSVAGYEAQSMFTPNALAIIAAESKGVPREINRLCFNALSLGFAVGKRIIDAELLYEVRGDLQTRAAHPPEEAEERPPAFSRHTRSPQGRTPVSTRSSSHMAPAPPTAPRPRGNPQRPPAVREQSPANAPARWIPAASPAPATAPAAGNTSRSPAVAAPDADASDPFRARPRPRPQVLGRSVAAPPPEAPPQAATPPAAVAGPAPTATPVDAVQQVQLGIAIARHRKPSRITIGQLAGYGLLLPLALWLLAFLIVRFHIGEGIGLH